MKNFLEGRGKYFNRMGSFYSNIVFLPHFGGYQVVFRREDILEWENWGSSRFNDINIFHLNKIITTSSNGSLTNHFAFAINKCGLGVHFALHQIVYQYKKTSHWYLLLKVIEYCMNHFSIFKGPEKIQHFLQLFVSNI